MVLLPISEGTDDHGMFTASLFGIKPSKLRSLVRLDKTGQKEEPKKFLVLE